MLKKYFGLAYLIIFLNIFSLKIDFTPQFQELDEIINFKTIDFKADIKIYEKELLDILDIKKFDITKLDLLKAVKKLENKNRFEKINVEVDQATQKITINLYANWLLNKLKITGSLTDKSLLRDEYIIFPGEPFDIYKHRHSIKKIRKILQLLGYFDAQINSKVHYNEQFKYVNIDIKISKIFKYKIESTFVDLIAGKEDFDDKKYLIFSIKKILQRYEHKNYSSDILNEIKCKIKDHIALLGYTPSKITIKKFINKTTKKVDITVKINMPVFKKVEFIGNYYFSSSFISNFIVSRGFALAILPNDCFKDDIISLYQNNGFENVSVTNYEDDTKIVFIINEGLQNKTESIQEIKIVDQEIKNQICEQKYFGKTIVSGNIKTSPFAIFREMAYKEGDDFNSDKIDLTLRNLVRLGVFEHISISHQDSEENNKKDILIKIIDDDSFEAIGRVGFQQVNNTFTNLSGSTYRLGASLIWKNPRYIADTLRLDGDITRFKRRFTLSYESAWTFSFPVRSIFQVYSNRDQQFIISGTDEKLYREAHDGLLVNLNKSIENFEFDLNSGFEWMKIFDISERLASVIDFDFSLVNKRFFYIYLEPSLIFNNLNNKVNPSSGSFTLFSSKIMAPAFIENGYFIRMLLEHSRFFKIHSKIILAARLRAGYIFNDKFQTLLPTVRFYLGGATSLRAYQQSQAPPLNPYEQNGKLIWVPVGGKAMLDFNSEIRFNIYKKFGGVIFTDMGLLKSDFPVVVSGQDILGVTGFGLRYCTPVGPIRFDLGFKWRKQNPEDSRVMFFLTFGEAF